MSTRIPIYHLTHKNNLSGILSEGCLYCDREAQNHLVQATAYQHLKRRRAQTRVPNIGDTLDHYVPFYFAPRSPMLYAIYKGNVSGVSPDQRPLIYLVTYVDTILNNGLSFIFTDRHPLSFGVRWSTDIGNLPAMIDWEVMRSLTWCDTADYPNRKSRRQAEFLVYHKLPFNLIEKIGVYDTAIRQEVLELLHATPYQPLVSVERSWYY